MISTDAILHNRSFTGECLKINHGEFIVKAATVMDRLNHASYCHDVFTVRVYKHPDKNQLAHRIIARCKTFAFTTE